MRSTTTVTAVCVALALCLIASVPGTLASCPNVPTATNFDLKQYVGRWYEIADSLSFKKFFEKDLMCTTANYTIEDGYVKVVNGGRIGSPTGKISQAIGRAEQVAGAKLKVKFGGPVYAPYWILDLIGDAASGYQVSLVWSCDDILGLFTTKTLWVLSRTPQLPAGITLDDLYAKVASFGIDVPSLNMTLTTQSPDCLYI